ncbi:MAG: hypothetical protein ABEI27_10825 [Halobellus sp.]|uniref:hypothetical protein n=1 Tax=Halobellus sp. TaxID=1979212 RepID=UPI0035D4A894
MSTVPTSIDPFRNESVRQVHSLLRDALQTVAGSVQWAIRAASFWIAITLPLLYLPLLANGFAAGEGLSFTGLIGANALAFLVGHGHEPRTRRE